MKCKKKSRAEKVRFLSPIGQITDDENALMSVEEALVFFLGYNSPINADLKRISFGKGGLASFSTIHQKCGLKGLQNWITTHPYFCTQRGNFVV